MLYLILKSFIDGEYIYEYYPEGKEEFGIISYNTITKEVSCLKLTSYDGSAKRYMGHAFQALFKFEKTGEFPGKYQRAWG